MGRMRASLERSDGVGDKGSRGLSRGPSQIVTRIDLRGPHVPVWNAFHTSFRTSPPLRLGEGGKVGKGPVGMGLRLQDSLRLGAFKVEACAAKVTTDGAQGGKDEAWGGRAHVRYDWLPVRPTDRRARALPPLMTKTMIMRSAMRRDVTKPTLLPRSSPFSGRRHAV